jgi:hypothetical protein
MSFFRGDARISRIYDERCAFAVYLVLVAQTALPHRVAQEHFVVVRYIFERLSFQRRGQNDLDSFATPIRRRLVECRVNNRCRRVRNFDEMRAAGKQSTNKNSDSDTAVSYLFISQPAPVLLRRSEGTGARGYGSRPCTWSPREAIGRPIPYGRFVPDHPQIVPATAADCYSFP